MKRWLLILLITAMVVLAQPLPVEAQVGAGTWAFQQVPVRPFQVVQWGGDIFVIGQYRQDTDTRGTPPQTTVSTDSFYNEGVDLKGQGYIYHPNLIDWNASVRLGLSQQDIQAGDTSTNSDGTILGYSLGALFLKEKPISFRVYASMDQNNLNRSFARNITLDTQTQGGEMTLKGKVPVSVLLEHQTIDEVSDVRTDNQDILRGRIAIADERDRNWRTALTYEHEEIAETATYFVVSEPPEDLPDSRDELNVSNLWRFEPGLNADQLSGHMRVLHRQGYYPEDQYYLDQRLDLHHSPTLSSFYRGSYTSDTTADQSNQTIEGEAGVTQKFYQSLDATLRVLGNDNEYTGGQQQYAGIYTDLNYRKHTPLGLLTSTLTAGYEDHQDSADSGIRQITNESVTLNGIVPVVLRNPNVLGGTVVVTNASHSITYVEGIDYLLQPFGTFTQIVRLAGGTINDGQTVLVSYTVTGSTNAQYAREILDWNVRLDLSVLPVSLYSIYQVQDDSLESGTDPGYLDQHQSITVGVEVRPIRPLRLSAEQQWNTQVLFPSYSAYRFRALYNEVFSRNVSVTATAYYENLSYSDGAAFGLGPGQDFLETYSANANLNLKLSNSLLVRLETDYYHQAGRNNNEQLSIGPSLQWISGQTQLSLDSYYRIYTQETDHGQSVYVGVKLTRYF